MNNQKQKKVRIAQLEQGVEKKDKEIVFLQTVLREVKKRKLIKGRRVVSDNDLSFS